MTALHGTDRTMDPGDSNLTAILGDLPTFEADILHRTPHVRQVGVAQVGRLLSVDDVDHLLTSAGLRIPFVSLVRNDKIIPSDQYCRRIRLGPSDVPDLIHPDRVIGHLRSGATLILQGMQRYWPPLSRLCRQIEAHWGFACHANAYLTPPAALGFAEHDDSHDTLIVQAHGTKQWTLAQRRPAGDAADATENDGRWTLTLRHPAALYIPAGTRHAAYTAEHASLHITIGMTPPTWDRVARRAVELALAKLDLSERLPTGALAGRADLESGLQDLTARLAETIRRLPPEAIVSSLVAEFVDKGPPPPPGQLKAALGDLEVPR